MPVGNAEYFDNLNKEIKEKQSELSLSSSKVVAMKQMIADRDKEIETMINVLIDGFETLKEDPLSDKIIEIYNDPIWNN